LKERLKAWVGKYLMQLVKTDFVIVFDFC